MEMGGYLNSSMSLSPVSFLLQNKVDFEKREMLDVCPAATDPDTGVLKEGGCKRNTEPWNDIDP